MSSAILAARGSSFSRSSSRFGSKSEVYKATPVALPPGRLRLVTRPSPIGLGPTMKRTGMVAVASFAALADTVPPGRHDQGHPPVYQVGCQPRQPRKLTLRPTVLDPDVPAFDIAAFA